MKRITTLLAILFASTSLGACLDLEGGSLDAPAPVWASGYVFSFTEYGRVTSKSSGAGPDGDGNREDNDKVGPYRIVYEVLNTTLKGARTEPAYLVAFSREREDRSTQDKTVRVEAGGQTFEFERKDSNVVLAAVRQRDLNDMPVRWSFDSECENRVCRSSLDSLSIDAGPLWTFLDFPLKAGRTWTASTHQDVEDFDDLQMRIKAEVQGRARASTPLGSLNAVRVEYEYQPEGLDELKERLRNEARDEGVEIRDLDLSLRKRLVIYYSPVYQNVVRVDRTLDQSFRVSGSDKGQDFNFAFERRAEFHRELTGARLVTYPERDLDGIGRVLLGDKPIADPSGQAFKPGGYSVRIEADKRSLNVATGEEARFKAVLKGVQELPASHSAQWRVVDASGRPVETTASGLELAFKPAEPGLYLVEVETRDGNGNLTSGAAAPLAANYRASRSVACPNVVVSPGLASSCPTWELPVRPGISTLRVEATVSGPLLQLEAGELRVRDAAGVVARDTSRSGNTYSVEFGAERPFNIKGVNDQDWILEYAPSRSVMGSARYDVKMFYGDEPDAPRTPSASMDEFVARWTRMELGGIGALAH